MNKIFKILAVLFALLTVPVFAATQTTTAAKAPAAKQAAAVTYQEIPSPVLVVDNPYAYLHKNIQFKAKFNKFSTLGLDYPSAKREAQAYIGILIDRDDAGEYTIPLSEFKMFLKRTDAEKFVDLEAGDTILVKGNVFSSALGDPWLDINELKIISKKNPKDTQK